MKSYAFRFEGAAPRLSGEPPHSQSCQRPKGTPDSVNEACWCSCIDSDITAGQLLALALRPTPVTACTFAAEGEDTEGVVMYRANVIEVRVWLRILPDLHRPLLEGRRQWEGSREASAQPGGLLVPLAAIIFLMSRDQKSASLLVFPCFKLRKMPKSAPLSSLQVKGTSLTRSTAWVQGWVRGGKALTQCFALLEATPGVLVRGILQY